MLNRILQLDVQLHANICRASFVKTICFIENENLHVFRNSVLLPFALQFYLKRQASCEYKCIVLVMRILVVLDVEIYIASLVVWTIKFGKNCSIAAETFEQ